MAKKVVIIENDKDILDVISYILNDAGYLVGCFQTNNVTLEHISNEKPDLILLDVITASKEGTALCEAIKADSKLESIPVVALSTHLKPKLIQEACADEVVKKPFDIDELLQVVENHLEAHA